MGREFESVPEMVAALAPSYPVYCLHPERIAGAARHFVDTFPGRVLYAVKCNPHPAVLRMLYRAGVRHFDTASLNEIAQVRELFSDANLYFMHPVKARAVVASAHDVYGVDHYVIDHPSELEKTLSQTGTDGVAIIVRVATPSAGASYDLSAKFGARPAGAVELLRAVRAEGCQAGLAFHVGSQCTNPGAYRTALGIVGRVLDAAGEEIHFLDVGGGFPGTYLGVSTPPLTEFFAEIEAGVAELGLRRDCVLMCEPGRALVATGCSLVVQVQLRKGDQIYVNDGIYGSLSEAFTAGLRYPVRLLRSTSEGGTGSDGEPQDFTVYGPTCDSTDVLPAPFRLPAGVREGDWIEIARVGAYSNALATRFNGFHPETFVEITRPDPWD